MSKKYVELFASASINPKVTLGELIQEAKNKKEKESENKSDTTKNEKTK